MILRYASEDAWGAAPWGTLCEQGKMRMSASLIWVMHGIVQHAQVWEPRKQKRRGLSADSTEFVFVRCIVCETPLRESNFQSRITLNPSRVRDQLSAFGICAVVMTVDRQKRIFVLQRMSHGLACARVQL